MRMRARAHHTNEGEMTCSIVQKTLMLGRVCLVERINSYNGKIVSDQRDSFYAN